MRGYSSLFPISTLLLSESSAPDWRRLIVLSSPLLVHRTRQIWSSSPADDKLTQSLYSCFNLQQGVTQQRQRYAHCCSRSTQYSLWRIPMHLLHRQPPAHAATARPGRPTRASSTARPSPPPPRPALPRKPTRHSASSVGSLFT